MVLSQNLDIAEQGTGIRGILVVACICCHAKLVVFSLRLATRIKDAAATHTYFEYPLHACWYLSTGKYV